jgi:phosphatidylserine decarboxylase
VAVFPADGRHLAFADVDKAGGFYVKGSTFTLGELLGDPGQASRFAGGSMLISRLCPSDYHRFHFPVAGVPSEARLVKGSLYSVSPIALRRSILYLVRNKRLVTQIETKAFGTVAMVEVGATNVGSIVEGFLPGRPVAKGDEKGMFSFGGSCVITLFERNRITIDPDLLEQSAGCVETYARMGDRLGVAPG